MIERWLPVAGFESLYEVSDRGRVRSLDRRDRHGRRYKGQIIQASPGKTGYPRVNLRRDGNSDIRFVHRLVAEMFLDADGTRQFVNHINGVKHDNRVENLEWCTTAENNQHAHDSGLTTTVRGSDSNLSSINESQARLIARCLLSGLPKRWIARQFRIGCPAVTAIALKKTWNHVTWDILESRINSPLPSGDSHHNAKLTTPQVRVIARCVSLGLSYPEIAGVFGVSSKNIGYIARRQTWRHATSDIL